MWAHDRHQRILAMLDARGQVGAQNLADLLATEFGLEYTATSIAGPGTESFEFPLTNSVLTRSDRVQVLAAESRQGCSRYNYDVRYIPGACEQGTYGLFNRPPLVVDLEAGTATVAGSSPRAGSRRLLWRRSIVRSQRRNASSSSSAVPVPGTPGSGSSGASVETRRLTEATACCPGTGAARRARAGSPNHHWPWACTASPGRWSWNSPPRSKLATG